MSKYIDADLLRAVIKEHILFYAGQANLLDGTNTLDGFDETLSIIDSLQQEQPEVDLEKETKMWWKEHLHLNPESQLWMDAHQSVSLARHFYELGLKAKEE